MRDAGTYGEGRARDVVSSTGPNTAPSPGASPAARRLPSTAALAALAALLALIALQRLHTYDEPIERDVGTYSVVAREWRHGRLLYSDLVENKPPLLYVVFAAVQEVVGDGPPSIFVVGLLCAGLTTIALYGAGARAGTSAGGLCAAALWAILCSDLRLQANQPNIEALLNVTLCGGFAFLLWTRPGRVLDHRFWAASASLAAATLFKPLVIPIVVALATLDALAPPPGMERRRWLARAPALLVFCATPW